MHRQRRSADGQKHRPLHQSDRPHGGQRERRRRSGSTATAQPAPGPADRTLDTADGTIDSRTADRASASTCLHKLNQRVAITDYAHDQIGKHTGHTK